MLWFAIRSLYLFGQKSDGTNIFEERIVGFHAESVDEAFLNAERESEEYSSGRFVVHPERELYKQDGDALIDGYELWSTLFEAKMSLDEFYQAHYQQYDYRPE